MYAYAVTAVLLIGLSDVMVNGLQCYECVNARSVTHCRRKGWIRTCAKDEVCMTIVRRQVGTKRMKITKRCKQRLACINDFNQNNVGVMNATHRQCTWEYSSPAFSSVCRCCCQTNQCNSGLYDACRAPQVEFDPTPVEARCPSIEGFPLNGGQTCTRDNYPSSHCHFTCEDSYNLVGEKDISCQMRERGFAAWTGEVPCCARTCPPYGAIDLVLGIQSSGFTQTQWERVKTFAANIIAEMVRLTSFETRVKMFLFQEKLDRSNTQLRFQHPNEVMADIEDLQWSNRKGSSWHAPLSHVQRAALTPSSGNREGVKDVFLMIVYDLPTFESKSDATVPARQLRDDGVKILVIGVLSDNTAPRRRAFMQKLLQITGSAEKIILLDYGIGSLNDKQWALQQALCGHPCRV